jgi:hypothetical protein
MRRHYVLVHVVTETEKLVTGSDWTSALPCHMQRSHGALLNDSRRVMWVVTHMMMAQQFLQMVQGV